MAMGITASKGTGMASKEAAETERARDERVSRDEAGRTATCAPWSARRLGVAWSRGGVKAVCTGYSVQGQVLRPDIASNGHGCVHAPTHIPHHYAPTPLGRWIGSAFYANRSACAGLHEIYGK